MNKQEYLFHNIELSKFTEIIIKAKEYACSVESHYSLNKTSSIMCTFDTSKDQKEFEKYI